ncbi:MAG: cytochrome c biogenesis protein ResB [Anaeromyxobacteraceae bacterium]
MKRPTELVWDFFTSLKLTIVCLAALMVLVVACTLAQVSLGTWGAVEVYMRSWLVWWHPTGSGFGIPVMPGGALVGLVLLVNLISAQVRRLQRTWSKAGIWIAHAGLVLLVMGEFITALAQRETQLAFHNGETVNFVQSPREMELTLVDTTDAATDDVYSVAAVTLARRDTIPVPGTPVTLKIHAYHRNAFLGMRKQGDPPGAATAGMGTDLVFSPLPPVSRDEEINRSVALVEPLVGGQSMGTFLVSNALGQAQGFQALGRTYELQMRSLREYLPYALTLREFRHDVYMGTQIPKNFSSQVHITNPVRGESRDVLIYMNQPLRYEGKTFYQSSFGENDTLSILQVVENPGWLVPYVSCVLVALGLLVHFGITFRRSMARREKAEAAAGRAATTEAV